ncbi:1,4-dihydroxy-2-naphthoate octaprenyltransferase [Pinisolibacter sp.]|uniref:1,4-dihydroxy-2-naphthoate octaprenyltransferase n=1 Tax=Pinisolibacter sp. TaxID=2172024 RepID=UPI002FDDD8DB
MSEVSSVTELSRFSLWIRAVRPRTLSISVAPIIVGVAHAWATHERVAVVPVVAATISALAIQIATNLANDAADGERGHDGPARLGPERVTGSSLMSAAEVKRGAVVATLVAALFGLVAVVHGGVPILLIGLASILAGWAYSNGPLPISATPTGEAFVVACFGVAAVVGIEWLASDAVGASAAALGVAIGLPAAAVLTVNNHRDRDEDARNGRRTLAILLGARGSKALYAVELLVAVAIATAVVAPRGLAVTLLVAACAVPALVASWRLARMPVGRELNGRLAATAGFQMMLAMVIAVALIGGIA